MNCRLIRAWEYAAPSSVFHDCKETKVGVSLVQQLIRIGWGEI